MSSSKKLEIKTVNTSCSYCQSRIDLIWTNLKIMCYFRTPDFNRTVLFHIKKIENDKIYLEVQNISISKSAFVATLHYLHENHHSIFKPCLIKSNNDILKAGPLCKISREQNGETRCINYIIPILQNNGLVGLSCKRPNKAWIL